jgi:hypothetical protein
MIAPLMRGRRVYSADKGGGATASCCVSPFSGHLPMASSTLMSQQLPDSRTRNEGGSSIAGLHDGERREAVAERSHGTTLSPLGYVSVRWADLHRLCITYGTRTCGTIGEPPARIGHLLNPSRAGPYADASQRVRFPSWRRQARYPPPDAS